MRTRRPGRARDRSSERGTGLVTFMFGVALMLEYSLLISMRTFNEMRIARYQTAYDGALYAAEAAVDNTIQVLRDNGTLSAAVVTLPQSSFKYWISLPVTPAGQPPAGQTLQRFQAYGRAETGQVGAGQVGTVTAHIDATVALGPPPAGPPGPPAVFARTHTEFLSNYYTIVDAYDPAVGPYNSNPADPGRVGTADVIRTDSTDHGELKFSRQQIHVWGNIVTGYANPAVSPNWVIEDNPAPIHESGIPPYRYAATAAFNPPPVPLPDQSCADGEVDDHQGDTLLSSSTYKYCSIELLGTDKIITSGTSLITVHVKKNLTMGGQSTITGTAPVRFIIGGSLEVKSDTRVTPIGIGTDPAKLRFDIAGSGSTVKLIAPSGSVQGDPDSPYLKLYGFVYAPGREVETTGARIEVFGGLVGNIVKLSAADMLIHNPVSGGGGGPGGGTRTVDLVVWSFR